MSTPYTICAIVLNYLGHKDTISCVKDLLREKVSTIIIVDNSNDPNEIKIIREAFHQKRLVTVLNPKKNLGFARGINFALSHIDISSHQFYLLLNNDIFIPKGTISSITSFMGEKELDVAAPVIYEYPNVKKIWSSGNFYHKYTGAIFKKFSFLPGSIFYLTGCFLIVRQSVFKSLRMLDESFFFYGEDVEFCNRAINKGFKIGIISSRYIYHKGSASARKNSLFYEYHINLAHFILSKKLSSNDIEIFLSVIGKSIFLFLRAIYRTVKYTNLNSLRGYLKAVQKQVHNK